MTVVVEKLISLLNKMFKSRMRRFIPWAPFCWAIISYSPHVLAENSAEYMLKAAFLYNFSVYTRWPDGHVDSFKLCIYGSDSFGPNLDIQMKSKKINEFPITVYRINNIDHLDQCQLVFISRSAIANITNIIKALKGKPVLTVADSPDAIRYGASLSMDVKEDQIIFEASIIAARENGLNFSSQLLRFASKVYQ